MKEMEWQPLSCTVRCSGCKRTVELPRIGFPDGWRYDLKTLEGWVGVPWLCPDCIRGKAVAEALMGENTNG